MASVAVQAGHCFRTRGSTGAPGEQHFADRVSRRVVDLLEQRGHSAARVLADGVRYRAWDAFVAIHYDGHSSADVSGASVGYRANAPSREMAQEWKRQYRRLGWPYSFRSDNYTRALSGYYGNRLAQRAGTRAAVICEFGFGTNATERQWMEAHIDECAHSVVATIGALHGHPRGDAPEPEPDDEPLEADEMIHLWKGTSPGGTHGYWLVQFRIDREHPGRRGVYAAVRPDELRQWQHRAESDRVPDVVDATKHEAQPGWFDRLDPADG